MWWGETPADLADEYAEYVGRTGVADLQATPGNLGVEVLRRDLGDGRVEFLVAFYWESLDAIRAFAGDEVDRARYYPDDAKFLFALDLKAWHYERPLVGGVAGT
jgi:hypothetical protein